MRRKYYQTRRIGIIGLGYVGQTLAAFLADGNIVTCYDIDKSRMQKIKESKKGDIKEKDLNLYIHRAMDKNKLYFADSLLEMLDKSLEFLFVTVGTPSYDDGSIDLTAVNSVAMSIGIELSKIKISEYMCPLTIVLKSTVIPGTTREFISIIEKYSKRKEGKDFYVVYNPEFLREGSAINDLEYPQKIVLGGSRKSLKEIKEFYEEYYVDSMGIDGIEEMIISTTYENAELVKYANNAFLATKISFINEIANICEKTPNTDVGVIAEALGLDDRISPKFLRAGLGYGGSCFSKDVEALIKYSKEDALVLKSVFRKNKYQREKPLTITDAWLGKDKTVAILGVAFKPETDDIRDAPAIYLIDVILKGGATVRVYDPEVSAEVLISKFDGNLIVTASAKHALKGADYAIICTEWDEFKKLDPNDFKLLMNKPVLFDGRRIFDPKTFIKAGVTYYGIGHGKHDA